MNEQEKEREATLKILDDQIKEAELYALWWMNAASNGHAATREVYKVIDGDRRRMNAQELTNEAMQTAKRHIERHRSLFETRVGFARTGVIE